MPKKFSLKGRKKQVITAAVVVLVLLIAAAVGAVVRFWQHGPSAGNNKDSGVNLGQEAPTDTLPAKVQEAQDQASQGNVDQSNKTITDALAAASSNDEKYELYLQQGVNAENEQKYADALAAYKKAEALKQTFTIYKSLGRVETALNDKQAAIGYYQKAITLISQTDALRSFEKDDLEKTIKSLGG